jgi:hypothetical protein
VETKQSLTFFQVRVQFKEGTSKAKVSQSSDCSWEKRGMRGMKKEDKQRVDGWIRDI